jgi:RNA polymerase sigma-70 factor, ECF subfamily
MDAVSISTTATIDLELEPHRRALTGFCYRMLGSGFEAEDAVQETMVRAWRRADTLQSPEALRSWLYRIATNVCLDMLQGAQRRARPMELGSLTSAQGPIPAPLPDQAWLQPVADRQVLASGDDPAELAVARETIRLAFVAALQHLPSRQRAVLILREVLRFRASEVAELLDTSVASVNSALQRARATLEELDIDEDQSPAVEEEHEELLARYVDAFERYDIDELVALLHADATFSMPPHPMWLVGPQEVSRWLLGHGRGCRGSRVLPVSANGSSGFASYRPDPDGSGHHPFAIVLLEARDGRIGAVHNFLFPDLFAAFGLPERLEAQAAPTRTE